MQSDLNQQRFNVLSWKIVECKLQYYRGDLVHEDWKEELTVTDAEYDRIEDEYKSLAQKLELEPYASEMVGFDLDRPSAKLVLSKYSTPKKKTRKKVKKS